MWVSVLKTSLRTCGRFVTRAPVVLAHQVLPRAQAVAPLQAQVVQTLVPAAPVAQVLSAVALAHHQALVIAARPVPLLVQTAVLPPHRHPVKQALALVLQVHLQVAHLVQAAVLQAPLALLRAQVVHRVVSL